VSRIVTWPQAGHTPRSVVASSPIRHRKHFTSVDLVPLAFYTVGGFRYVFNHNTHPVRSRQHSTTPRSAEESAR
jgi:hypothetical protein